MPENLPLDRLWARIADARHSPQCLVDVHLEVQLDTEIEDEDRRLLRNWAEELILGCGAWGKVLPTSLESCRWCGEPRDRAPGGTISLCRCAGTACRFCAAGRVRRPISDHYRLDDHRIWHTSWFGAMLPCPACREVRMEIELNSGRLPIENDELKRQLAPVRTVAQALGQPAHESDGPLPQHDLIAVHGNVEVWHGLRLGAPPDGRPLFVGRRQEDAQLKWRPAELRVATWSHGGTGECDIGLVQQALLDRWEPPLNREVETPWTR